MSLDDLLARADRWLATHRPDYHAHLRAGASDAALDAFEARFTLVLPTAFRRLYHWHDGQDPACMQALQDNRMFSSLDDIAETKSICDSMIGFDFDDPRHWRRAWVPFLHNGGGSHLCVDLAAEDGGQAGQLVAFWKADDDRPIEHTSIEAWLAELVESMDDGSLELAHGSTA